MATLMAGREARPGCPSIANRPIGAHTQAGSRTIAYKLLEEILNTANNSESVENGGSGFTRGYITGLASAAQIVMESGGRKEGADVE